MNIIIFLKLKQLLDYYIIILIFLPEVKKVLKIVIFIRKNLRHKLAEVYVKTCLTTLYDRVGAEIFAFAIFAVTSLPQISDPLVNVNIKSQFEPSDKLNAAAKVFPWTGEMILIRTSTV